MSAVAKISLDPTAFQTGAKAVEKSMSDIGRRSKESASQINSTFGGALSSIGNLGMGAIGKLAGLAAGAMTVGKIISESWGAMSEGGELVDLQEQTGVTIPKLMALKVAFEQAGLGASEVQPVVAKLQRAIFDANKTTGPASKAFEVLGLSVAELADMTADEQLLKVGDAIAGLQNPTIKAAVAMEVFGKSGGRMLSFFATGGLDDAAAAVGNQAEIMQRYASAFDVITDNLGTYHTKLRGFFVGAMAAISPYLTGVSNWFKTLDFSQIGTQVGEAIATIYEVFAQGDLGTLLGDSLKVGFGEAANFLFAYLVSEVKTVQYAFKKIFEGSGPIISQLGQMLSFAAQLFTATLKTGIGETLYALKNTRFFGAEFGRVGGNMIRSGRMLSTEASDLLGQAAQDFKGLAGESLENLGENLLDVGREFAKNFRSAMASPLVDTQESFDAIADRLHLAAETVRQASVDAAANVKLPEKPTGGADIATLFGEPKGATRPGQIFGQFGTMGAGTVRGTFMALDPMVAQQKRTNAILQKIETNTAPDAAPARMAPPAYQS